MALIECKNCGHMISDKAYLCPNCGNNVNHKGTKGFKYVRLTILLGGIIVIILIMGIICRPANNNENELTISSEDTHNDQDNTSAQKGNASSFSDNEDDVYLDESNKDIETCSSKKDLCLYYSLTPSQELSALRMVNYPMTIVMGNWDEYNAEGLAHQLSLEGIPKDECDESNRNSGFYFFGGSDKDVLHWWEQRLFYFNDICIRRMDLGIDYYSYETYGVKIDKAKEALEIFENELGSKDISFSDNTNRKIWRTPSRIAYYNSKIIVTEINEFNGQQGAPDENERYGAIIISILNKSVYDRYETSNIIYE